MRSNWDRGNILEAKVGEHTDKDEKTLEQSRHKIETMVRYYWHKGNKIENRDYIEIKLG